MAVIERTITTSIGVASHESEPLPWERTIDQSLGLAQEYVGFLTKISHSLHVNQTIFVTKGVFSHSLGVGSQASANHRHTVIEHSLGIGQTIIVSPKPLTISQSLGITSTFDTTGSDTNGETAVDEGIGVGQTITVNFEKNLTVSHSLGVGTWGVGFETDVTQIYRSYVSA